MLEKIKEVLVFHMSCPGQIRELYGYRVAGSQPGEHFEQKMVGRKTELLEEKGARLSQARFNFWL
jgi:hypothetical protein